VADQKLPEIRAVIERSELVRGWLECAARCECPTLDQCPLFDDPPLLPPTPKTAITRKDTARNMGKCDRRAIARLRRRP
jgi:hypothetical protein